MNQKQQLGKQIKEIRESLEIRHVDLVKKGIHQNTQNIIEKGEKGYTIDRLVEYLDAFGKPYKLEVTF